MTLFDTAYCYTGLGNCEARCGLRAYQTSTCGIVVIASELRENRGTSVTNFAEQLATAILTELKVEPGQMTWIEHYPERVSSYSEREREETFDLVTFDFDADRREFIQPQWKRWTRAQVEGVIGEPFAPLPAPSQIGEQ